MKRSTGKPSKEAKAISLFLMAYKSIDPIYKEKLKRINKQWDRVRDGDISKEEYLDEVESMLAAYGGYSKVIEKTVEYYIEKTGAWKSQGEDQYSIDAKEVANSILKNR
ncbi:MAG: hypothetical protein ACPG4Z_04580 [Chitinophagales bacterium]